MPILDDGQGASYLVPRKGDEHEGVDAVFCSVVLCTPESADHPDIFYKETIPAAISRAIRCGGIPIKIESGVTAGKKQSDPISAWTKVYVREAKYAQA